MPFGEWLGAFRTIGVSDVLDISIVAGLLYLILLWFERTRSAFVARGVIIFALVYLVAQQSGMYLTTSIFKGFFAVFLIALVVIFQEELRSFFERLAVWSFKRRRTARVLTKEVEILVQTVAQFAHERVGALIVLKGLDPLERHLEGEMDLDGKVSGPLLLSLFDPHSEGHDGAVVIQADRVVCYGAHLPLSKTLHKLAGLGTRHTAALGLSERADALCIVVSEEKGSISIARDGELLAINNLMRLEEHITAFLKDKAPATREARWSWAYLIRHNAAEKAIALAVAVVLWAVFAREPRSAMRQVQTPAELSSEPEAPAATSPR